MSEAGPAMKNKVSLREMVWMAFTRLIDDCEDRAGIAILVSARRQVEANWQD